MQRAKQQEITTLTISILASLFLAYSPSLAAAWRRRRADAAAMRRRRSLGFSYRSWRFASSKTPVCCNCLLKRRRALSNDSFSRTSTVAKLYPPFLSPELMRGQDWLYASLLLPLRAYALYDTRLLTVKSLACFYREIGLLLWIFTAVFEALYYFKSIIAHIFIHKNA